MSPDNTDREVRRNIRIGKSLHARQTFDARSAQHIGMAPPPTSTADDCRQGSNHAADRVDSHCVTTPTGYDAEFLSPDAVPIPTVVDLVPLTYTHFSVLMRPSRRLCAITAVNIDGPSLADIGREDDWRLDPRIPATDQAGPELYSNNDLDRGHLVRRRDPVWGDTATATRANLDTFHYTVCAPQTATFNQSKELWAGLEDYLLEHAETTDERLTVLTGPLFRDDDPVYRGLAIPRKFFKVGVWFTGTAIAATGYVLDQAPSLDSIVRTADTEVPPLGPYKTFQVPISDIADLSDLPMSQLVDVDRYAPARAADDPERRPWTELNTTADITGVVAT